MTALAWLRRSPEGQAARKSSTTSAAGRTRTPSLKEEMSAATTGCKEGSRRGSRRPSMEVFRGWLRKLLPTESAPQTTFEETEAVERRSSEDSMEAWRNRHFLSVSNGRVQRSGRLASAPPSIAVVPTEPAGPPQGPPLRDNGRRSTWSTARSSGNEWELPSDFRKGGRKRAQDDSAMRMQLPGEVPEPLPEPLAMVTRRRSEPLVMEEPQPPPKTHRRAEPSPPARSARRTATSSTSSVPEEPLPDEIFWGSMTGSKAPSRVCSPAKTYSTGTTSESRISTSAGIAA